MPPKKSNTGKESILELIQGKIKNESNFEKILEKIKFEPPDDEEAIEQDLTDRSTRGFYFERLWDLCIKFGLTELTLKKTETEWTTHWEGNADNDIVNSDEDFWKKTKFENGYLKNSVRSGNTGGYSDITFLNTIGEKEELYLISVKYYDKAKD